MFDKRITCCYLHPITKYGYPPPAEKTTDYVYEMRGLGFTSIELEGIRENHLSIVFEERYAIKETLRKLNVELPYFCAVLPGLSSSDEKERLRNIGLFDKGCRIAALFNSKGILDNAPLPPYQFPGDIPVVRHYGEEALSAAYLPDGFEWNKYADILADTFKTLCEIAAGYNLTYQLHPAVGTLASTADGYLYFSDRINKDNLRFNLDTANLFALKENLPLSLLKLKDQIDYIHFSDNGGTKVEHLPAGRGIIKWEKFFEALDKINFSGNIGVDIGGEESKVENLDDAYRNAATYLEKYWLKNKA